ncbi:MAG: hypothetical protein NUV51_01235 [Sulfuricaulis sp.]|nr:hypothetical protein [Sulfuricaulis sp.]
MTTGYLNLFPGGVAPDGSGTGNNTAALSYEVSTGVQTTNTPKVTRHKLLFDPTTDEHWMFQFKMPGDYASGGTLRGQIGVNAVSPGNVIMKAGISESIGNRTDDVFLAADLSSAIAMPATANQGTEFTIPLTMTNIAANDEVVIFIGRDANNASDTVNSNDVELTSLNFEYTTT